LQTYLVHQVEDGTTRDLKAFPLQLPPDLARAIDLEVLIEHAPDLDLQRDVALARAGRLVGSLRFAVWS